VETHVERQGRGGKEDAECGDYAQFAPRDPQGFVAAQEHNGGKQYDSQAVAVE